MQAQDKLNQCMCTGLPNHMILMTVHISNMYKHYSKHISSQHKT